MIKGTKGLSTKTFMILLLLALFILILIMPREIIKEPGIIGAVVSRVFVSGLQINHSCSVELVSGWNLISIPCVMQDTSVDSMLVSIQGNYESIHTYNSEDLQDPWKSYKPNLPSWVVEDLSSISNHDGYWVYMNSGDTLVNNGTIEKPDSISLYSGWNLVGFASNESQNTTEAFDSITGKYSIVYAYNATSMVYQSYDPNSNNNTLNIIDISRGYWINATEDSGWFID